MVKPCLVDIEKSPGQQADVGTQLASASESLLSGAKLALEHYQMSAQECQINDKGLSGLTLRRRQINSDSLKS